MSTTKVINCHVKELRKMRGKNASYNLKEWCDESENHVYVGRAGIVFVPNGEGTKVRYPAKASIWANPYKVSPGGGNPQDVLRLFELHVRKKLEKDPRLIQELLKLEGKTLGCWCKPAPCHGDVLVKLIAEYKLKEEDKDKTNKSVI